MNERVEQSAVGNDSGELWGYKELSKYMKLSEGTLRKLVKNGTLPTLRPTDAIRGRSVRFNSEQVKSALNKLARFESTASSVGA